MNPQTEQAKADRLRRNHLDEARLTYPFVRILCDYDIMFCKRTIIQKPDGSVEFVDEYSPDVQNSINRSRETIRMIQKEIWGANERQKSVDGRAQK